MEVVLAHPKHLEEVVVLFGQYRVFYKQSSDLKATSSLRRKSRSHL
jgi:hypothetical protein